jgi:hypothetical protein
MLFENEETEQMNLTVGQGKSWRHYPIVKNIEQANIS